MAENRFKKSIESATENTVENITEIIPENIRENLTENLLESIIEKPTENIRENILEKVLGDGKKYKGGSHTIYLSGEVGEALVKYAKKAKKSKSEIVDSILREVFRV
jgi:hypothetical protein